MGPSGPGPWDVVLFAAGLVAAWVLWRYSLWWRRGVPHETPLPLLGNTLDSLLFRKSVGYIATDIYRRLGGHSYVGMYRFATPILIICDPDLVKEVLVQKFSSFHDNETQQDESPDPLLSQNPFSATQARWKSTRTLLSPAFTLSKVRSFFPIMQAKAKEMVRYVGDMHHEAGQGDGLEVKDLAARYTTDVSIAVSLSMEGGGFKSDRPLFLKAGAELFGSGWLAVSKLTLWFTFPALFNRFKLRIVQQDTEDLFTKVISEAIEHRNKEGIKRHDFLDIVLSAFDSTAPLDKKTMFETVGRVLSFFLESYETSSLTITSCLACLALNPETQHKLRKELQQAFPAGNLDLDKLDSLPYLENVLKEALRLFEVSPMMTRICTAPTTLCPDGQKPIRVEEGTTVAIPVNALHHDPRYFPDPDRFDPDRFLPEVAETRHKFSYLPFGEGPRICIGMRYAMAQVKTAIAELVLNFDLEVSPKQNVPPKRDLNAALLVFEGGSWLRFIRRSK